jgi:metallo-beta-lactamase family protein
MKIKFCGAARQVTGSMHLVELESGYKVLIDCGLDYEQQRDFHRDPEVLFLFDPKSIDCVILTHSHVDHSGNLPTLVKAGFGGKIICTPPTAELTGFLLLDSLRIMESESKKKSQKGKNRKKSQRSLYGYKDLREAAERFVTVHFYQPFTINDELEITFREAGHILGAASVLMTVREKEKTIRIGFTGDLGNYSSKLMKDPEPFSDIDYLITESTYGGRFHKAVRAPEDELLHYIEETCVKQPGRLVIPAFSVGRTQAIIFALNKLATQGKLPPVKIFVDSPLAIRTTHVYSHFRQYLNDEAREFINRHERLFEFDQLHYIHDHRDSEIIENHYEPCVIISAAGMVEGGRIQEHVRNNIRNAYCTILIAGFCAEGTLGYKLLQGQDFIHINGTELPVFAQVAATDAFSAHPDHNGLIRYIRASGGKNINKIFLVHGEESSMLLLKEALEENSSGNVMIPEKGEVFHLS